MVQKLFKKSIISGKKEISGIYKTGNKWRSSFFTIIFKKNSLPYDRFAVLVSKKNGNSVERNGIKRRYREVFRTNKRFHQPFFDLLILPKAGFSPQPREIKSTFLSWILLSEKE